MQAWYCYAAVIGQLERHHLYMSAATLCLITSGKQQGDN